MTRTIRHSKQILGYVTMYEGRAGVAFLRALTAAELRAFAAELVTAADELERRAALDENEKDDQRLKPGAWFFGDY